MKPVLICGGVGTKMWPASRESWPKHFLPLINGKSLFEINYRVLRKKFSSGQIYVQTSEKQAKIAQRLAPEIPQKNYFLEPEMRNHGPATGFTAAKLFKLDPDEPFIIIQADLLREPEKEYLKTIELIEKLIKRDGCLITGGERVKFAVMGIDYLMVKRKVKAEKGIKCFQLEKWVWRDTKENLKPYFRANSLLAHWNHFAWTPRKTLEAFAKYRPDWHLPLRKMLEVFGTKNEAAVVKREYAKMSKGPIEEITCDLTGQIEVVELPFSCTDFGTWESVGRYFQKTKRKKESELLEIDSKNCLVKKEKNKFVALIGVWDLAIIDTHDALLVCQKEQSDKVGEVVDFLRQKRKNRLL